MLPTITKLRHFSATFSLHILRLEKECYWIATCFKMLFYLPFTPCKNIKRSTRTGPTFPSPLCLYGSIRILGPPSSPLSHWLLLVVWLSIINLLLIHLLLDVNIHVPMGEVVSRGVSGCGWVVGAVRGQHVVQAVERGATTRQGMDNVRADVAKVREGWRVGRQLMVRRCGRCGQTIGTGR